MSGEMRVDFRDTSTPMLFKPEGEKLEPISGGTQSLHQNREGYCQVNGLQTYGVPKIGCSSLLLIPPYCGSNIPPSVNLTVPAAEFQKRINNTYLMKHPHFLDLTHSKAR